MSIDDPYDCPTESSLAATAGGEVAVVAWQAFPAVFPAGGRGVGGIETSAWNFCKGLAARTKWKSTLVLRAPRSLPADRVDGVRIFASLERMESIRRDVSQCIDFGNKKIKRWSSHLLWQLPALVVTRPWRARDPELMRPDPRLLKLNPDVWVAMGVGRESAGVIATAKHQCRPSLLMLRSAADIDPRYGQDTVTYSPYGERSDVCRFALENADYIVAQTEVQQQRLKSIFGRESQLIRNPIQLDRWQVPRSSQGKPHVLWIGRFESYAKRIDMAIDVARACPDVMFRMIVNPDDPDIEARVRFDLPRNVALTNYVPFDQMPNRFADASVFLSTSDANAEGFPNVLLQAAASGTPIVALDEFDGFIGRSRAGFVCEGDVLRAARRIQEIVAGHITVDKNQVSNYLREHHTHQVVIAQLASLLNGAVRKDGVSEG